MCSKVVGREKPTLDLHEKQKANLLFKMIRKVLVGLVMEALWYLAK